MNVLLVSSAPGFSAQVISALDDGQLALEEVATPERALALLDEDPARADVVVADNDTQPSGGFVLARDLKARVRMGVAMPPVILAVAREQDDYLARWSEADAWVVKPVDPFDLAEAAEALAEHREVPKLPGVRTYAETGAITGPGRVGELPSPSAGSRDG